MRRRATRTSAFGSPGRINHDSAAFYGSRLYEELPREKPMEPIENALKSEFTDRIFCKSSESMDELPDNSVHLVVTSPPYNVGKEYDRNLTLTEYREFLQRIWKETERVLVPGGRICVNIANLGRRPYIPLHVFIVEDMLKLGLLMRGEIIWNKASSSSTSTAWGSWLSAVNPTLRDVHEYLLVFSKGMFRRDDHKRGSTISRAEFLEFTKSVWTFGAEPARKVGHPAPFPVELPYRCIQLYTFKGEVVLDPFMGSGQSAIAAISAARHYVGYEIKPEYVELSRSRIESYLSKPRANPFGT